MRTKKKFHVIGFASTDHAMAWEAYCKSQGIPGRIIPLPEQIAAGCGLAWRMLPEEWLMYGARLEQAGLKKEKDADLLMYG